MRRRCVFVWENIGPMHRDRLEALHQRHPGDIFAIQFASRSEAYEWLPSDGDTPTETLFRTPAQVRGIKLVLSLVGACRRLRARDVYLCHYQRWEVLIVSALLRLMGFRIVAMIDSKFDDYRRFLHREVGKSLFLLPYSAAMAASRRSVDYLHFLGFRSRPIMTGYDTLSIARIRAQSTLPPAPEGVGHGERDFLIIARLLPKKNIALALEAYACWRALSGGRRQLRILGSGPLDEDLRRRAEQLGIADGVIFEGFVQSARVSEALGRSLCLILPSIEEQFGLVVVEAMALGVPALLSSNAGAADVMIDNGVNGWLISPQSPAALVQAMTRLDGDEAEWARMARAARDDSARGDTVHFVAAVEDFSGSPGSGAQS